MGGSLGDNLTREEGIGKPIFRHTHFNRRHCVKHF
jgi:hypothetical protein